MKNIMQFVAVVKGEDWKRRFRARFRLREGAIENSNKRAVQMHYNLQGAIYTPPPTARAILPQNSLAPFFLLQ